MKKSIIILLLALVLAIATRFYLLGKAPAGLYLDEAAQGYNAYSILLTGKDEFGMLFPAVFRSFADFKTPIYIYLIAPLIPLFGLTAFTVRFPSFIASIITLPVLYFLIRLLTPNKKTGLVLAAASSLLLAISPWHILFGRTNFECNVALLLYLTGVLFFYLGLKKSPFLAVSAFFLAIALPAYHSQRLLVPVTLIFFLVRFGKILFDPKHRRFSSIAFIIGLVISIPTITILPTPGFLARVSALNLGGSLPGTITDTGQLSWLINLPLFLRLKEFLSLYISYFSPRNLFFLGDYGPRSSFPGLSTFFIWQLPFYFHGLYLLIKKKELGELRTFVIFMLLASPLPAALTRDPFTTIRALPLVIPLCIVISLSLFDLYHRLKHNWQKLAAMVGFTLLIVYSLLKLYSSVIILNEKYRAPYWDYGWEQVVNVLNTKTDQSLPVVIDNVRFEPYSQILFYTKYDPAKYQKENFEVSLSEYYTNLSRVKDKKIGRIELRSIDWKPDLAKEQYLVGDYLAISQEQIDRHKLVLIEEIFYPDGSPAYRIVQTNPEYNSATIK